jgi:hypothetical protein
LRVTLPGSATQTFTIRPVSSLTTLQKAIIEDWLRGAR